MSAREFFFWMLRKGWPSSSRARDMAKVIVCAHFLAGRRLSMVDPCWTVCLLPDFLTAASCRSCGHTTQGMVAPVQYHGSSGDVFNAESLASFVAGRRLMSDTVQKWTVRLRWTFSPKGSHGSAWVQCSGTLVSLSEQLFVECDSTGSGCICGLADELHWR